MKRIRLAGIVLMVLGVVALAYQGVTYTTKEKVVEVGPVHVTTEVQKTIPLPPLLGASALAVGLALAAAGSRRV